jgi:hypothetical protein
MLHLESGFFFKIIITFEGIFHFMQINFQEVDMFGNTCINPLSGSTLPLTSKIVWR